MNREKATSARETGRHFRCGWLPLGCLFALAWLPRVAHAEILAITNVQIHTRSDAGVIENGSVLIRDGVIEAVGTSIEIPGDAQVIDGGGATLTPGLIDSQSQLWLTPTSRGDTSSTAACEPSTVWTLLTSRITRSFGKA